MTIFNFITLFGGLALFLYGMEVMGDGLKNSSGAALKKVLEKVTNNLIMGVLVGTLVTAVIQSSTATIVLTVGLMGAGILNFRQSVGIVMGANIGTTITAQIIRLMDIDSSGATILEFFKPSTLAPLAAVIGIILLMFVKSSKTKNLGEILLGFGVLFIGLMNMTAAVEPLEQSTLFVDLITKFSNVPVLGIVVGTVFTAIIQSSSASVGIIQALSSTGLITFDVVYPLIMGCNIGTCVTTAMVCSIGTNDDSKRTGIVHILFNMIGTIVFMIVLTILRNAGFWPDLWSSVSSSGDIANFQTVFNLLTCVCLLPFTGLIVKAAHAIIKPKEDTDPEDYTELNSLDEKLFMSPPIAVRQAMSAITKMAALAQKNFRKSLGQLKNYDKDVSAKIYERENRLDEFTDVADNYLIKLAGHVENEEDNKLINVLIQSITDFERIGDYAVNIEEIAKSMKDDNISFSETAIKELDIITEALDEIIETTITAFSYDDTNIAKAIEPLEEVIDEMVDILRAEHINRLKAGTCSANVGIMFVELLTNIERAADQCSNIGVFIIGKHDSAILNNHHSYLREVHKGNDPIYSSEFNAKHDKYILPLKALGA
ncbi:MAG: Na/Pi cotransporter family protein [Lachnospiraceae bacterium]|nr:Na/Pi cotransporter family protein [Lachnospiraceae bacterium]